MNNNESSQNGRECGVSVPGVESPGSNQTQALYKNLVIYISLTYYKEIRPALAV